MSLLLEIKDVTKTYGGGFMRGEGNTALDNISFGIDGEKPSITAVAGESGSGKSTLAKLLLGFIKPTSGTVFYQGEDISKIRGASRQHFRREVQAVLQDPYEAFNPFYKVDHVLNMPIAKYGLANSRDEAREMAETALRTVGLRPADTLGRYPHQLSGGQRQRVMVARTVLLKPKIILADEPVSMVDASLRATILESLLQLHQEQGISILYITHDLNTAYQVAQNIMVLYRGSVVETGSVESVIEQPKHPYTQLLVSSIPAPNTEDRWRDQDLSESGDMEVQSADVTGGCKYIALCPVAMPRCSQSLPPVYLAKEEHGAACFLYEDETETTLAELPSMYPQQELVSSSS